MKPLLVIGSRGQLAQAIRHFRPNAIFLERSIADLSHPHKLTEILEQYDPYAVINAAAYTSVDNAESEESLATIVNSQSPAAMAIYCARRHIPFVHLSTDYVFNGSGDIPWREDDSPEPLNAYGRSKLAGEDAIARVGGKYLIFRTSWVYDAEGRNFLNSILRLASEREELRIINDQFGAPTYARHLARAILMIVDAALKLPKFPSGIYNMCNKGVTSWYGFAIEIVQYARDLDLPVKVRHILPIPTTEYPLPAKRPHNSRLDCSKIKSTFDITMPSWQEGLTACMELKKK